MRKPSRLKALWIDFSSDERGVVWTIELIMAATILALGSMVGLATFRDSIVQEFGDLAAAAAELDQSYRYSEVSADDTIGSVKFEYLIPGSGYTDETDFCVPAPTDPVGDAPMCITFGGTADEGT
jgi:hypothetical protein